MIKYTSTVHQFIKIYQKLIKCFSNSIPINIIQNILYEKIIDMVNEEIANKKDFEKSAIEIETFDTIEELRFPQDYQKSSIIILVDLNEKEIIIDKIQAMFKRGRHNNLSIFIISQDYYEIPKRTIRANGNIYDTFKPNNFRDAPNLYQDKASMNMNLNEFKLLTSACWNKSYQPLTID